MSDPAEPINDNDSVFLSNTEDTCRICRAEGTKESPLFHPCKCSGSIRFVHQECLMEWLQHSQKKYCELCKTPFCFTKVYDPDMPTRLPMPIFVKLAFTHLYRLIVQILRFVLVVFVWLFWLPWSIRSVWRFYFWVADGGLFEAGYHQGLMYGNMLVNSNMSTPVSPKVAIEQTRNSSLAINGTILPSPAVRSSYRIGAGLANLTSSPQANQIILDTFEGQIITILVVFAFILIFLIREWVVQQQPPVPLDGNAQFGQADQRVDDLIAAVGRAREERAARAPRREQEQNANGAEQQPVEVVAAAAAAAAAAPPPPPPADPIPHIPAGPQPMFADRRRARNHQHDDDNTSEESIFGGSDSDFSFNGSRSDDGDIAQGQEHRADNTVQAQGGPHPLQDLMDIVDFNPGSEYNSLRNQALRDGEALQLAADLQETSGNTTGTDIRNESAAPIRRAQGHAAPGLEIDENYMDSQAAATRPSASGGLVRRPSLDRERIARAAEMRRNIEERGGFTGGSTSLNRFSIPEAPEEEGEPSNLEDQSLQEATRDRDTSENKGKAADNTGPNVIEKSSDDDNNISSPPTVPPPQPPNGGLQNSYNFDLSSSGSDLNWSKYSEYSSKLDEEKETVKGKGLFGRSTSHDQAGESSQSAGSSWNRFPDPSWAEGEDDDSSEDGNLPPLMGFNTASESATIDQIGTGSSETTKFEGSSPEESMNSAQNGTNADSNRFAVEPDMDSGDEEEQQFEEHDFPEVFDHGHNVLINNDDNVDNVMGLPEPMEQAEDGFQRDDILPALEVNPPAADDVAGLAEDEIEVDVDDLDGVLELVGMRGPLMALVQNGMFSAVLITATIGIGVWVPYIWGRIVLLVLGHPLVFFAIVPHKVVMMLVNLCIDVTLLIFSSSIHLTDRLVKAFLMPTAWVVPQIRFIVKSNMIPNFTRGITASAQKRIATSFKLFVTQNIVLKELQLSQLRKNTIQLPGLSDLNILKARLTGILTAVAGWLGVEGSKFVVKMQDWISRIPSPSETLPTNSTSQLFSQGLGNSTMTNLSHAANVTIPRASGLVPTPQQFRWSAFDQVMSVVAGYAFFTVVGAVYLQRKRAMAQDGQPSRGVERRVIDGLAQAGSVMKVVLIIGIEMFVFPLYCGILLDFALLPLFENATIWTRWKFMSDYVFTSLFVHWFIGTCYMFHFALFVSMCRKIMREGVLYFIRDPDDPTFHPVKEVLERPVSTQLKKIGFSAFIYGILVVVFLGGVVWTLAYGFNGLLPIHWSSNEPVLEFPVDLLFYNFFMPIAIKYFRPANTLEKMYGWWFRICAKVLRLSCFLFGDRHPEEEGQQVHNTWKSWILMRKANLEKSLSDSDIASAKENNSLPEVYFHRDGRFVRAPAKDSVRPGRENLFIPVSEDNKRLDGKPDPANGEFGPNNANVRVVYLPPRFKTRIGIIIGLIWFFTAACGVAVTIGPLVFGRLVLGMMLPNNLRMNDLYAFSLGLYSFGAVLFLATSYESIKNWVVKSVRSIKSYAAVKEMTWMYTARTLRVLYVLVAFVVVLPSLFALVMEFYVIIPIQTYFSNGEKHFIHFIQDWTLGVLYIKLMGRMLLMNQESPWAQELRRIVHRGYLDPDVAVATKKFILPGAAAMLAALFIPMVVGLAITRAFFADSPKTIIHQVYRYSYPAVLAIFVVGVGLYFLKEAFDLWKQSLRDEIYLRGEQLHNHGDNQRSAAAPVDSTTPLLAELPIDEADDDQVVVPEMHGALVAEG